MSTVQSIKRWGKKNKGTVTLLVLVAIIVPTLVIAWPYIFGGLQAPPTEEGVFDVVGWDGSRNIELPASAFDWTIYGVEGTSLDDFGQFEELDTGTSLADLGSGDLDPDYDQWVVKVNGTVEADWWDEDDAGIDEIDTTYDHVYYERWFVLVDEQTNYMIMYEQPSDADFIVMNSQTFAAVNVTAGIVAQTNVTLVAATNMSQSDARYVTGANYANEDNDQPEFTVTFNDTVSLNWMGCSGAVKSRVNDTAIRFSFSVLSPTPSIFNLVWGEDAVDVEIIAFELSFGDTSLATES